MFRATRGELEFLLVHPGGPFWRSKDQGAWTIPKGEIRPGEDPLAAAQREFGEELGFKATGRFVRLTPVKQKGGKVIRAWAFKGDCDPSKCRSNTFEIEWPPRSGKFQVFPEVDRAEFFRFKEASEKINPAQAGFLLEIQKVYI